MGHFMQDLEGAEPSEAADAADQHCNEDGSLLGIEATHKALEQAVDEFMDRLCQASAMRNGSWVPCWSFAGPTSIRSLS